MTTTTLTNVLYETKGAIAYVTLNRPKVLNALRLVGKGRALQIILSGEMISAQEAYRIGLVNEVVPAGEVIARCEAILKQILTNAPIAVHFALEAVNKGMETSLSAGLLLEASVFAICAGTEDKREGTAAFLEKRAARFQGR